MRIVGNHCDEVEALRAGWDTTSLIISLFSKALGISKDDVATARRRNTVLQELDDTDWIIAPDKTFPESIEAGLLLSAQRDPCIEELVCLKAI